MICASLVVMQMRVENIYLRLKHMIRISVYKNVFRIIYIYIYICIDECEYLWSTLIGFWEGLYPNATNAFTSKVIYAASLYTKSMKTCV